MKIRGSKPRPRVAVIGFPVTNEKRARLENLFSSISFYRSFEQLEKHTSSKEIDLLILGEKVEDSSELIFSISIISFSFIPPLMPGPTVNFYMKLSEPGKTEEFIENKIALEYSRIREKEDWTNAKGWLKILTDGRKPIVPSNFKNAYSIIRDGAILMDSHSGNPFVTIFINEERKLGVAWFPLPVKHKIDWIEAIVNEWSKSFPDKFPTIGNWARQNEWLLAEEIKIQNDIKSLEEQKIAMNKKIDGEIASLTKNFQEITANHDKGLRKLLIAQGDELVNIVKTAFEQIGFIVEKVDENIEDGKPKKEDLRLTKKDVKNWEAIVEVRGYTKSSGKEDDIKRLDKFSKLYNKEKEKFPDKMIYVVNGPIELQPSQRQKPFESNPEFLESIADDDGLVISTITLYHVLQSVDKINISDISKSIVESTGELKFVPPN